MGRPVLSTGRKIREDYFGLGNANASLFVIPIGVPGGMDDRHHQFSTNLADHNAAVARYRLVRAR